MNICPYSASFSWIDFIALIVLPFLPIAISYFEYKRNVYRTTMDFLNQGNTSEEKERRKKLYDKFEEKNHKLTEQDLIELDEGGELGKIISFFDMWAYMAKRRYLPIKTFYGMNGVTAIRLFIILYPYIQYRRNKEMTIFTSDVDKVHKIRISNKPYAGDYEWLVRKIIKKKGLHKKGYVDMIAILNLLNEKKA